MCAGHGAPDGGAEGDSGILEKDLNLAVSKKLQAYFEQNGIKVIVTRADDSGIFDDGATIRAKKNQDLKNREKMIENSNADAFLSIHMNKFAQKEYSGPQVFFSPNNKESEQLAMCVQQGLIDGLKPKKNREIKKADGSIYLLKKSQIPSVLIECGFLSNDEEEKKLITDSYQTRIAWSIYTGVLKYFEK